MAVTTRSTQRTFDFVITSMLAFLVSACGGGGSGASPATTATTPVVTTPVVTTPAPPVLTFAGAGGATATVAAGQSTAISVDANVTTPSDFTGTSVYAYIMDADSVILPGVALTQINSSTYRAVMQTAPTLAAGKYAGAFTVKVCRDAACTQQLPGSPMQLPYEIVVTAPVAIPMTVTPFSVLDLTINAGIEPARAIPVNVNAAPGVTWTAASTAKWINVANASGRGNDAFVVEYKVAALVLGSQAGTIVVTASDGQVVTLPVTAQLLESVFSVNLGEVAFSAINGAPIASENIEIKLGDGAVTWSAISNVPWLTVTPGSGTVPGSPTLTVDPSIGKLASGKYPGALTFTAPNVKPTTVPVTLKLSKATLKASKNIVTLGGTYGRDQDQATISLSLNTAANAFPWSFSPLPSWLSASPSAGTINQTGANVTLAPVNAKLPIGTSVASLMASATVNGDTVNAPVTVTANRDEHKLLFAEVGVALTSTPAWSRLERTVAVADNFGLAPSWTVSADQPWLTVTRTGDSVTLRADPANLPANAVSYATVKLSSSDADVVTTEPMRVAIWKGDTTPSAITQMDTRFTTIEIDPIRPYYYVNGTVGTIDVYNFYTNLLVGSIVNTGASLLSSIGVSPNGDTLYAHDMANARVIAVDLKTLLKKAAFPVTTTGISSGLVVIRPNGVEIVAVGGFLFRASDGKQMGNVGINPRSTSRDGKRLYTNTTANDIDYSAMADGTAFVKNAGRTPNADTAASADGKQFYVATSTSGTHCSVYSAATLVQTGYLPGSGASPNNVEVGSDGRVYCGSSTLLSTGAEVWVHSPAGVLLRSYRVTKGGDLQGNTLRIAGDGLMMLGTIADAHIVIVPVGP